MITLCVSYLGRWFTIVYPQVPEKFFGHFASRLGCKVHSMRQLPHKKPPFYSTSTKRISYKVFSIVPFADALREQNVIELKESVLFSGREEVIGRESNDPVDELQAAKNRSYWSTANKAQPDKRANYKATLDVSEGEGRSTREVELIWWPELFTATKQGKLAVRFFIKKVFI